MKTKIKRHSRSVLSVILAICILISCMVAGLIATDAAKTAEERAGAKADDEALGDTTYYMHIGVGSNFRTSAGIAFTYDSTKSLYYASYELTANSEYPMVICTTSGALGDGQKSSSNQSVTSLATEFNPNSIQFDYFEYKTNNFDGYDCFKLKTKTKQTVYFSFDSSEKKLVVSSTAPDGGSGGGGGGGGGGGETSVTDNDLIDVLKGTKIMIYFGDKWGSGTKYVKNGTTANSNATSGTPEKLTIDNSNCYVANGYISTGAKYSISNQPSSWAGMSINSGSNMTTSQGGYLYYMYNDGSNKLVTKTSNAAVSWTTSTDTITEGDSSCSIAATVSGTTGAGRSVSVKYYYTTNNTNFYTFDPSDTSELTAGTYTIYATAYDTKIHVAASTQATLTVEEPEAKHAVTITSSPSAGGSVSPATGTEIGEETATQIEATPSAGYQFSSWNFGNGITYSSTTANPTNITTKSSGTYSVQANFSKKNLDVTVTQPASGGTISSDKSTAQIGDTVTVTATPAAGYSLSSISYSSTAGSGTATGTGDTRTFTMPGADTTVTATFGKINYTVSKTVNPTGSGTVTVKKTNSSGASVSQYNIGDTLYLTASPAAAYTFNNFTVTYGDGTTETKNNNTTIDMTGKTGNITVQGNFTKKPTHKITVKTNNVAYGTATASVGEAYEGQSVTLTATENTGTFSKWVVTSGTVSNVNNDTNKSKTFSMGSTDLVITANFTAYSANSNFYYNSYGSNGQPASTHYGARMTEAKINGETYSYYHVTNRTETDQLFTISYTTPKYNNYDCFFEIYKDWESSGVSALFYATDGKNLGGWANMTWVEDKESTKKFKIAIPDGARSVKFKNNAGNQDETNELFFTSGYNGWYHSGFNFTDVTGYNQSTPVSTSFWENFNSTKYTNAFNSGGFNNHSANRGESHSYTKPMGLNTDALKRDYYVLVLYKNKTYTINGVTKTITNDPEIIWLPELPGQTPADNPTVKVYAKDGTIRRDGDKPERNDRTYSYFEQHANTFVYSDSGYASHIGTRSSYDSQSSEGSSDYNGYTYDYVNKFNKGDTLYIKTNLDSTLKENYYLAAYCINGKTYELHAASESDDGVVTEAFTVPEDWEDKYVEITPIYFLRDSAGTNTITFYIEGYDETVMNAGWGNTPFVYPFYQDANFNYVSNINNAFGGYPGQPMVFYKGNYYIQLPKEITTTISTGQAGTATIKGVTLGNGYWDDIHYHIGEVKSHFQTYDYDDLYKIYNEKGNADRIICAFKYRTKKNNDEPPAPVTYSNYNSTNGNGWEVLTNYYGQPVDVFGNVLSGDAETLARSIMAGTTSADTAAVVHAISQDYKSNSAGDYATEWVIYNTSGTKVVASSGGKTSIVPSALAINANTSGTGELTDNFDKYDNATKAFKSIYTALYNDSNVLNQPAVVTYEKSIYGGGDKADRCDARWYFSQKDALITATTRIEYTDDGKTWTTDEYDANTGTGHITRTKAYFTGKASTATDTPSTTTGIDDTNTTTYSGNVGQGYYTIKAKNAGQYQFVGWYLLRDNYQNISTRSSYAADATEFPSHAEMSKNGDIFVARFKKTATGTFDIYHEIHPQTTGYGTVDVSAVVKKGDTVLHTYPSNGSGTSSHIQIGNDYIQSGEGNTIVATFTAAPYHTSNFDAFYATVQDLLQDFEGYDYIDSISISGGTATVTYNVDKMFSISGGSPVQTVSNVTHYSKFSLKTNLTYSLQYTFKTRYYGNKLYKYNNVEFTEQELRSYFLDQITDPNCNHIKLDKQFVKAKAPFESNFREDLTWVVDNVTFNNVNDPTIGYLTATQVSKKWATAMVYDFDNNGEMKTKTMVAPFEKLFDESVDTKPTYQSDEAEAQAIKDWSVDNDAMYHPLRTSYVPAGETSSAPLYIDHWDIYQLDSFTYKTTVNNNPKMMNDGYNLDVDLSKSVLVAQAYSSRFNYVGYEDYVVVPVYNKDKVDRQGASDKRTDSSATLLTLTRNQWNANVAGNTKGGSYIDSADRVYVDFMLNYNYSVKINGKDTNILLNSTGDNIKVGFIVRSYTWENEDKHYSKAQYVLVDKAQINDKNRMEYCFGFNNTANNRKAGLYYEFKPFIVDTSNQAGSAGCDVTISGETYKALYADSTVSVLDQVSFYQLGRL